MHFEMHRNEWQQGTVNWEDFVNVCVCVNVVYVCVCVCAMINRECNLMRKRRLRHQLSEGLELWEG